MDVAEKTSYFSHDSNARNDAKILRLRMKHGAEGYGIYFMIVERLRDASDYMSVKDYNMLAFDLRVDAGLVKSVVEEFGLFAFTEDGECFYSESLLRRMEIKDSKSEKRAEAGRLGALKRWGNADISASDSNAMAMPSKNIASKVKESKGKESKGKESKGSKDTICTERSDDHSMPAGVIALQLNDGSVHRVMDDEVKQWSDLYPAVDIMQELRKMAGWLNANPAKRKTKRGIDRFINNWLARTQDSGGTKGYAKQQPIEKDYTVENDPLKWWDEAAHE